MSVTSVSFWQQDQNYWAQGQRASQTQALSAAVISGMFGATSTLSKGLSSIANQTALNRTNSELSAAIQAALQSMTGGSGSSAQTGSTAATSSAAASSSSSASSTASSSAAAPASPAVGTGTAPLTTGTALFTLGIMTGGAITVGDGANTTTYKSTGGDTVGDLINAINTSAKGNANVSAGLNALGELTIAARTNTSTVTVGGIYAANLGFGTGNNAFQPVAAPAASSAPAASVSGSSSAGASTGTASGSAAATTPSPSSAGLTNSALALQTFGTAEMLLASGGSAGSLLNLLA